MNLSSISQFTITAGLDSRAPCQQLQHGRAALQKRIMTLLDIATMELQSYPKARVEEGKTNESFHRSAGNRRAEG
ncbi:hypothetical protein DAPPUDRAFT_275424 [Daphnia pulex]|uniref:Uncharacterized protein n=1 Tax=Daphnia pulex TaxID=6669 RepID=E9I5D4_DAPPU|nr:hypothetical protein DAPPUDRAFT_275424 [Daphnia pulex]|eukprot:EFX60796.1 hypothetical protein DAPPUDRAFT_275424 [Daphnia pulex]